MVPTSMRANVSVGGFLGAQFHDDIQVSAQVHFLGKFPVMRGERLPPQFKPCPVVPDHLCDRSTQFFWPCVENSPTVLGDYFLSGTKLAGDDWCSRGKRLSGGVAEGLVGKCGHDRCYGVLVQSLELVPREGATEMHICHALSQGLQFPLIAALAADDERCLV